MTYVDPIAGTPLRIQVDEDQLAELEQTLQAFPREIPQVAARALNRANSKVRSVMRKKAAKRLGVRQKAVKRRIWIKKARRDRLTARTRAGVVGLPLIEFRARQLKTKGTRVRIQGQTRYFPHAFIATMPSGHEGVYERRWAKGSARSAEIGAARGGDRPGRLPIYELRSPALTVVLTRADVDEMLAAGREVLEKRLAAEAERVLQRKLKRRRRAEDI